MIYKITSTLKNTTDTIFLSTLIALAICNSATIIYLYGDIGTGKTTFSRGFLRSLGYTGNVKSPTYTLIESYKLKLINVHHFDFYRFKNPEELEFIGIRDYFNTQSICLAEWSQQSEIFLPKPDIKIYLSYQRKGRAASIQAYTIHGKLILKKIKGQKQ
ncbi:tRNA (adenosine(37)-N6)-threonylcarbamoyltransferase complex ATPase subunit type 1 TsaE [Candidatus Profftia sp. (ex Adelges kitamiensis)]|uniref:tRNA (adenosine(37)-N6)-threonylcarbamoyltransferase complex ATPase subunit type 1 TsaE n=1 Tax=Candidatus Profftia sp. (ex Adelges kitamiensis) TaxID=2864218 RepID=UPI001CE27BCE|nr:tRNA (adenosine(37)-N6)-threonylcarbamoyltransferase complex ATPase subunit type 1 TsaE [Candidatus Profftia sp. (ex Adelges kitamiensis)]